MPAWAAIKLLPEEQWVRASALNLSGVWWRAATECVVFGSSHAGVLCMSAWVAPELLPEGQCVRALCLSLMVVIVASLSGQMGVSCTPALLSGAIWRWSYLFSKH